MNIVIKISNNFTDFETQIINPLNLSFSKELVNTGTANFKLSLFDDAIVNLLEFKKISIFAIENGKDKLLWTGYIDNLRNDLSDAFVSCSEEKDYLRNKIIFGNKDFSLVPVNSMLQTLVNEANSRKGINEMSLDYESSITTFAGKKYYAGTNYYQIISEVCEALNLEWDVQFNKIIVSQSIGIDRTIIGDDNFFQFIWIQNSLNENVLNEFSANRKSADIATHVFAKGGSTVEIVQGDKSVFGSIERAVTMGEGIVLTQAEQYLADHQLSQIERDFNCLINDRDARILDVGDTIKVQLVHDSSLVSTNENLKIIGKSFDFTENKKPDIRFKFSNFKKEIIDNATFLSKLNERVKRIELS